MSRASANPIMRLVDASPGWVCLVGGCFLLALLVLIPAWLQVRSVAWERDVMALQAERLTQQLERYEAFNTAVAADDPILLERLAFTELRLKPVGSDVFDAGPRALLASQTEIIPDEGVVLPAGARFSSPGSIQAWLHVPMPVVGQDIRPLPTLESKMVHVATGRHRIPALLVAAGILTMGLLMNGPRRTSRATTAAP